MAADEPHVTSVEDPPQEAETVPRKRHASQDSESSGDLKTNVGTSAKILYEINENLPIIPSILFCLQLLLTHVSAPIFAAFVIHSNICAGDNHLLRAQLLSSSIFMVGVCSILQIAFGVRLPVVQGSSYTFLPVATAMMVAEPCPPECADIGNGNDTTEMTTMFYAECDDEAWRPRLQQLNGALLLASFVQVLIAGTGIIGYLMNFVGPLTIAPTVALVGITLYDSALGPSSQHWGVASFAAVSYIVFVLFLARLKGPVPYYSKKRGCHVIWYPYMKILSRIFPLLLSWLLCYILTVTDTLPDDPDDPKYAARTDSKIDVISSANWFFFAYPGFYGGLQFGLGTFLGMLAATLSSIVESIGDYYAAAVMCNVPPPPKHAINRGIGMEGVGGMLCASSGICHATTTYTATVGQIGMTGVASRSAWIIAASTILVAGLVGKLGAALSIIPDPVIGGMNITGLGMLSAMGLSVLRHCDMTSVRNMIVLGTALMVGIMMPMYMASEPDVIQTGLPVLDQVLTIFLSTGMFIGGVIGFILDNLAPGTKEERGMATFLKELKTTDHSSDTCRVYDLPLISGWLRRVKCCSYVPFLPSYDTSRQMFTRCKKGEADVLKNTETSSGAESYDVHEMKRAVTTFENENGFISKF